MPELQVLAKEDVSHYISVGMRELHLGAFAVEVFSQKNVVARFDFYDHATAYIKFKALGLALAP